MPEINPTVVLEKLLRLRTELIDLAFALECKGRLDAADVAVATSGHIGELYEDLVRTTTDADARELSGLV